MPIISEEGGGGGGFAPVSCVAVCSLFDVHTAASYPLKWTGLVDNVWDFNVLGAIPTGLGLTFAVDGSSETLTTTEAGLWAFTLMLGVLAADAAIRAFTVLPFTGGGTLFGPVPASSAAIVATEVVALPSGAASSATVTVTTGSAANPYNVAPNMSIVRLA